MWTLSPRGPDWMPITPKTGSLFHAETHAIPLGGALASLRSVLTDLKSQAATLRFRSHQGAPDYAVHSVEDVNSLLAAQFGISLQTFLHYDVVV